MAFLVRDFDHDAPDNGHRPVKKIRRGAATAFVDAESGELLAGYSYNACIYLVASCEDHPDGRLYENITRYGNTSCRHKQWLLGLVSKRYQNEFIWLDKPNAEGSWHYVIPKQGPPNGEIDNAPYHMSADDMLRYIRREAYIVNLGDDSLDAVAA